MALPLSQLIFVPFLGAITIALTLFIQAKRRSLSFRQGPSSPSTLLGFVWELLRVRKLASLEAGWVKQYGTAYRLPACYGGAYRFKKPGYVQHFLNKMFSLELATYPAEDHQRQRKILYPAFLAAQIRRFSSNFNTSVKSGELEANGGKVAEAEATRWLPNMAFQAGLGILEIQVVLVNLIETFSFEVLEDECTMIMNNRLFEGEKGREQLLNRQAMFNDDKNEIQSIGSSSVYSPLTGKSIQANPTNPSTPASSRSHNENQESSRADLDKRETKRRRLSLDESSKVSRRSRNSRDLDRKEDISMSSDEEKIRLPSGSRAQPTRPLKRVSSPIITDLAPSSSKRPKLEEDDARESNLEEEEEEAYENMWADVQYRSDDEAPDKELTDHEETNVLVHLEDSPPPQKKHTVRMTGRHFQPQDESSDEDAPPYLWVGLDAMHPLKKPKRRVPPSQFHNRTYPLFVANRYGGKSMTRLSHDGVVE
ncbi:hypothetical protein L218DRAFT_990391 [Marasmius fiardii PR-910]|nr:hypothetical protein L218DRAFT_990391 [Marasmius fiardii PR-910]